MLNYFLIRESGKGNISSKAWRYGNVTPSVIEERNPTVIAENPSTVRKEFLAVFRSADDVVSWHQALEAELASKNLAMDEGLRNEIDRAINMFLNEFATIVFIDATALMCNQTLIHLTGHETSTKPTIDGGAENDYRNESHKILKSNGGTISADDAQGETECIFYHPPAWKYTAYSVQGSPFAGWFEYDNVTYAKSIGSISSQIVPKTYYHTLATFAWFGEADSNRMYNTAIPSAYIKNTLGWLQQQRYGDGREGAMCYLGDKEPSRYTWGNLKTYNFSEYTKPSVSDNIPLFIFYYTGHNDGAFQQLDLQSYTPAYNSLFPPSQWSEVWYSAVYAFFWNYTNAFTRGGFLVKTPFYRNSYYDIFYEQGIDEPTIADAIAWIPNIVWDGKADEFYNALFSTYGFPKLGEYASTYSGTKVGGFVCYASNESYGQDFRETDKIVDFANGDTSSYPVGKFTGQSQGTTVFYTREAAWANEQPASAVTVEQHSSSIELVHRVQFHFQAVDIVATVMLYGSVSPHWDVFSPTEKVEAVRSTLPLTIYLTSMRYAVLESIEWYADDPNETYTATVTDGVVTISIEEILSAYGVSLNEAEVEMIPSLFKDGKIPIHFKINRHDGHHQLNVASFFVNGERMGNVLNEWTE